MNDIEKTVMESEICMMCRPFLRTTGFNSDCAWHGAKAQERNTRAAPVGINPLSSNPVDDKIAPDNSDNAPAATDTGLETVAKVDSHLGDMSRLSIIDRPLSIGTEVCLRSQAAELLAAERAEKEELDAECRVLAKRCIEKDARIKELEWKAHNATISNKIGEDSAPMLWSEYAEALEADNAAKDETIRRQDIALRGALLEVERLKADNAAKDARIKELEKLCNDTEAEALSYASDKVELEAKITTAEKAARAAHDTLIEINPSNYNHDDVCQLNDASVEAIFLLADILGETHGKTKEWWDERRAVLGGKPS